MYQQIIDKEKREATIALYGVIGDDISGNRVAQDIASMDSEVDTIKVLINSNGGSVSEGLSIVSAILSARAYIHAFVNGIAASMAAVIAVAADKVTMQDYAKLMIHNPFYEGKGSDKLSNKERKALDSITDTLRTILSRRGCDKEKIATLMNNETWFSAEEAKAEGLADEVVTTSRKEELGSLSTSELMDRIMNENKSINNQPKKQMKEIAKALGLPEDATEQQMIDAIVDVKKQADEQRKLVVETFLRLGEKKGVVTTDNKDRMTRLAAADITLFLDLVQNEEDKPTQPQEPPLTKPDGKGSQRLSNAIAQLREKGAQNQRPERTWDWYQKNDPQALMEMERTDPEKFNRLLDEYEQSI